MRTHRDLIIAWANGAEIQVFDEHNKVWRYSIQPSWDEETQYRIKTKTGKYRIALMQSIDGYYTETLDSDESGYIEESDTDFVKWLTDWVEYEVP